MAAATAKLATIEMITAEFSITTLSRAAMLSTVVFHPCYSNILKLVVKKIQWRIKTKYNLRRIQTLSLRIFPQHKTTIQDSTNSSSKTRVTRSKGNTSKPCKHKKKTPWFFSTLWL
jgi:hypothetical protein